MIFDHHGDTITSLLTGGYLAVVDGEVMIDRAFTCASPSGKSTFYPPDMFWRESLQTANISKGSNFRKREIIKENFELTVLSASYF